MKTPILVLLLFYCCSTYAQKPLFVRVYDLSGKKIDKGKILAITDSTIQVQAASKTDTIAVRNIGSIRTLRASGHNIGIGMAVGGVSGAIFGAIAGKSSEPSDPSSQQWPAKVDVVTPGEAAVLGLVAGLAAGALVGAITNVFKDSEHVVINGDPAKWKTFQLIVTDHNTRQQQK